MSGLHRSAAEAPGPAAVTAEVLEAPAAVRRALRRGLELLADGRGGRGLEAETALEAFELAHGARCSAAKADKAVRWHQRNRRFATAPATSPAGVAWLLWGGAAGRVWFGRVARYYDGGRGGSVRSARG